MQQVIGKIETALDRPAYNYIIHTAPFDTQELGHYHWHIEIIPRLTKTAGFEWGTGFYINPVPPEEAAAFLREVWRSTHRTRKKFRRGRLDKQAFHLPIKAVLSSPRTLCVDSVIGPAHAHSHPLPVRPAQSSADRQLRRRLRAGLSRTAICRSSTSSSATRA